MNSVVLVGRLVRDPEIREYKETCVGKFTLSVNRCYKPKDGGARADFIRCTCFSSTARFMEKYFSKGMAVGVQGRLQSEMYETKSGEKRYMHEVIVTSVDFVERKFINETLRGLAGGGGGNPEDVPPSDAPVGGSSDFTPLTDDMDDEIPFA